jgi:CRISPR-associated protein Cmr6
MLNAYYLLSKFGGTGLAQKEDGSKLWGYGLKLKDNYKGKFLDYVLEKWDTESSSAPHQDYHHWHQQLFAPPAGHYYQYMCVETASPLWVGAGSDNILETSLAIHRIYGVPYIPATALKGITALYCKKWLSEQDEQFNAGKSYYNLLFGEQKEQGLIHFYDAFPKVDCVKDIFVKDVLTPHHPRYAKGEPPRDDDSPNPIPFLAVQGTFKLMLSCEQSTGEAGKRWLNIACEIVRGALEWHGAGGKTNAGYGRFKNVRKVGGP